MISYALVFMTPVLFALFFYYQSVSIVKTEIGRANAAMLKQVRYSVDARMNAIKKTGMQLATNPRIIQALTSEPGQAMSRIHYYNAMNELKSVAVHNTFVSQFYLFFNKFDKVMTPTEQTNWESFYASVRPANEMSHEEWRRIVKQPNHTGYRTIYINDARGNPAKVFSYFQPLPAYNKINPTGTLVMLIDEFEFQQMLSNISWINYGTTYILDRGDEILISSTNGGIPLPVGYDELTDENRVLYKRQDGRRVAVTYIASEETDWKYVSVMPYDVFWQNANYINMLFWVFGFGVIAFGFFLIRYVIRKNYSPVRTIMQTMEAKNHETGGRWRNEFEIIGSYMRSVSSEKDRLSQTLESKRELIRDSFLSGLLSEGRQREAPGEMAWEDYGVTFSGELFAVVLFHPDDFSELLPEKEYYGKSSVDIVKLAMKNVLEEMAAKRVQMVLFDKNGVLTGIVNLRAPLEPAEFEGAMDGILSDARSFFNENMGIYFTAAVSGLHNAPAALPAAYQEALTAMEYRLICGKNQTILHSRLREKRQWAYAYSIDDEQKLIRSILDGNDVLAGEILAKQLQDVKTREIDAIRLAKCLIYDIASTMMKVYNYVSDEAFAGEMQPLSRLISCDTLDDLEQEAMVLVRETAHYFQEQKSSVKLSDRVSEYVREHYRDVNVNVNMLGDRFGMAPSYLSKIFRQQTGERLLDYISKVRIEMSKELLVRSDKNINEIAGMVGYIDSNAYILAFKKKEGITPGQYRSNARQSAGK